jgi:hypothetical protein
MLSIDDAFAAVLEARNKAIDSVTDWLRFFYHKHKHADKVPSLADLEAEADTGIKTAMTFKLAMSQDGAPPVNHSNPGAVVPAHTLLPYSQFQKLIVAVAPGAGELVVSALYRRAVVETNKRKQANTDITPGLFAEITARSLDINLRLHKPGDN